MLISRRRLLAVGASASAVLVAGPVTAQSLTAVAVGTSGKEADSQAYFAAELGLFKKHGLEVKINTLAPALLASAVAGGELQFGDSNLISIGAAREKNITFLLVAAGGAYSSNAPTTLMVTSPNNPAKTAKDLNGKVIAGVSLGGLDDMVAHAWMDRNGGDATSIKFIALAPGEMLPALERGTIDAALLPEPALSAERARVRVLGKAYDAVATRFLIAGWFASAEWASKNPATVKAFADAITEAGQWANANREKAAIILEKYTKIAPDPANPVTHITFAPALDPTLIQPVIDAGVRYKIFARPFTAAEIMWK
jgi:NitT/TauT family transport system substrate-binding protein